MSSIIDREAPATRLAAYRALFFGFVVAYLLGRLPHLVQLADRDAADFAPVGVLSLLDAPPPSLSILGLVGVTIGATAGTALGWKYRLTAPLAALSLLLLTTLRSSWGQLLHFEHLIVLHAIVLAPAPAADAWSLDERRHRAAKPADTSEVSVRYGWPLALLAVVTVTTYVIAGVAKLRYGGIDWLSADTLRNHIAYTATRAELLGGSAAPLAEVAVRAGALLAPFAVASVVLELGAPLALLHRRLRNMWVGTVWGMHVAIGLTMWIGFPLALFGVAFAPMFAIEKPVQRVALRFESLRGHRLAS